jgi:hypothetical protein
VRSTSSPREGPRAIGDVDLVLAGVDDQAEERLVDAHFLGAAHAPAGDVRHAADDERGARGAHAQSIRVVELPHDLDLGVVIVRLRERRGPAPGQA